MIRIFPNDLSVLRLMGHY
ncbi:hypothetical protein [Ligilactobacillus salivarius]